MSEVQNCNNSNPETMESKGKQDTARGEVCGEHPPFPFFTIIEEISPFRLLQLTESCSVGVRSILCEAMVTSRLGQFGSLDSCLGLTIRVPSPMPATCSSPARLAHHPVTALCYSPCPCSAAPRDRVGLRYQEAASDTECPGAGGRLCRPYTDNPAPVGCQ